MENIFQNVSLEIPKPVREEVTITIRRAILRGEFKAGDRLVETEIAKALGVSRTPVREALRMLENEGLVRRVPRGGGVEVVGFSNEDIIELYTIRETLEVLAAEYAIRNISEKELKELESLVESSE
ncbi:MAG: GntR family transcriptional regulator, partial [Synergistales bacterium]|nr:GntR family transcriptional regulator [Synergistales bacterium]